MPSPVAGVTASSVAETLAGELRGIGGGEPCVVVAHSMGGTVATAAAELAPELFAHLVYVTAFAPVSGLPAGAYIGSPECEGSMVADRRRRQRRFITEIDAISQTPTTVVELDSSHSPFLSQPAALAAAIADACR